MNPVEILEAYKLGLISYSEARRMLGLDPSTTDSTAVPQPNTVLLFSHNPF